MYELGSLMELGMDCFLLIEVKKAHIIILRQISAWKMLENLPTGSESLIQHLITRRLHESRFHFVRRNVLGAAVSFDHFAFSEAVPENLDMNISFSFLTTY